MAGRALQELALQVPLEELFLAEPPDTDATLATCILLCATAGLGNGAEHLLDVCRFLEEVNAGTDEPASDLALAQANAWLALPHVPAGWARLEAGERLAGLASTSRIARRIDPADERDVLGGLVAEALFEERRAQGLDELALSSIAADLAPFAQAHASALRLHTLAAEASYLQGAMAAAWRHIELAEAALTRARPVLEPRECSQRERMLASVRCHWELASGLDDQAWLSLERERAVVAQVPDDPDSVYGLLLDVADVGLSLDLARPLAGVVKELDQRLALEGLFRDRPEFRASIRAMRALLQVRLERVGTSGEPRARTMLREALEQEGLETRIRMVAALNLVDLEIDAGELDSAAKRLSEFEADGTLASAPPWVRQGWVARLVTLSLARPLPRDELRTLHGEVMREFDGFLKTWEEVPIRQGGLGFAVSNGWRRLSGALFALECELEGQEVGSLHAFGHLMKIQALGSLARSFEAPPAELGRIRSELLGPGVGILCYLPTGVGLVHVFCLDDAGLVALPLPFTAASAAKSRELHEALTKRRTELSMEERNSLAASVGSLASDLARTLLPAEVTGRLRKWSGFYVVGAEELGFPIEVLPVAGRPLGLTHGIANLPSVPVGLALARRVVKPRTGPLSVLTVASNLVEVPGGPAIPVKRRDLEPLTRAGEILIDGDATFERLSARTSSASFDVLHLLAHGLSDWGRERFAGLAVPLSDEEPQRFLWSEDLLAPFLSPPLVLLSACGAARGPTRAGDHGQAQLAGAFLGRGAREVVQASSDIALEPTLLLMKGLLDGVSSGASTAESLRRAREALSNHPRFADPFYLYSLRLSGIGLEVGLREPR